MHPFSGNRFPKGSPAGLLGDRVCRADADHGCGRRDDADGGGRGAGRWAAMIPIASGVRVGDRLPRRAGWHELAGLAGAVMRPATLLIGYS